MAMATAGPGLLLRNGLLPCFAILFFAVAVTAESTDATKSTASGNGLQYATAGVQASFTVTAKVSQRSHACIP